MRFEDVLEAFGGDLRNLDALERRVGRLGLDLDKDERFVSSVTWPFDAVSEARTISAPLRRFADRAYFQIAADYHHGGTPGACGRLGERDVLDFSVHFVLPREAAERALERQLGPAHAVTRRGPSGPEVCLIYGEGGRTRYLRATEPGAFWFGRMHRTPLCAFPDRNEESLRAFLRSLPRTVGAIRGWRGWLEFVESIRPEMGLRANNIHEHSPHDGSRGSFVNIEVVPGIDAAHFGALLGFPEVYGRAVDVYMSRWQMAVPTRPSGEADALFRRYEAPTFGPYRLEADLERAPGWCGAPPGNVPAGGPCDLRLVPTVVRMISFHKGPEARAATSVVPPDASRPASVGPVDLDPGRAGAEKGSSGAPGAELPASGEAPFALLGDGLVVSVRWRVEKGESVVARGTLSVRGVELRVREVVSRTSDFDSGTQRSEKKFDPSSTLDCTALLRRVLASGPFRAKRRQDGTFELTFTTRQGDDTYRTFGHEHVTEMFVFDLSASECRRETRTYVDLST